jgi:transcriptional regulator with XRE-family HTH domain
LHKAKLSIIKNTNLGIFDSALCRWRGWGHPLDIHQRLKEERLRLGLDQKELAAKLGIAVTTQLGYEKGHRSPTANYLATVETLGFDVLYVLTGRQKICTEEYYLVPEKGRLSPEQAYAIEDFLRLSIAEQQNVGRLIKGLLLVEAGNKK